MPINSSGANQKNRTEKLALLEAWFALCGEEAIAQRPMVGSASEALPAFLDRVFREVPFYRRLAPAPIGPRALSGLPLVCRHDFASCPEDFQFPSVPNAVVIKTSGTTARGLTIQFDCASWYEHNIGAYGYLRPMLDGLGLRLAPGQLSVAAVVSKDGREAVDLWLPSLDMSLYRRFILGADDVRDAEVVRQLRTTTIPILHGKPHVLRRLADLDRLVLSRDGTERISAQSILVSGEALYPDDLDVFKRWFRCPVVDAYLSTEGGLVAVGVPGGPEAKVLENRIVLEVLRADGNVTGTGYGELVLTNLCNWATSFVRYRTGDSGNLRRNRSGQLLLKLHGREHREIDLGAAKFSTSRLDAIFLALGVWDFRVTIEEPGRLNCRWVRTPHSGTSTVVHSELERFFHTVAPNCHTFIEECKELTIRGGKRVRYPRRIACCARSVES